MAHNILSRHILMDQQKIKPIKIRTFLLLNSAVCCPPQPAFTAVLFSLITDRLTLYVPVQWSKTLCINVKKKSPVTVTVTNLLFFLSFIQNIHLISVGPNTPTEIHCMSSFQLITSCQFQEQLSSILSGKSLIVLKRDLLYSEAL